KKVSNNIVSHYLPHNLGAINYQIIQNIDVMNPTNYPQISKGYYQFDDAKYYYPANNLLISCNSENINIITTDSKIKFDTEIIFNLTDKNKNLGECIEDLLLCIDIPVLRPTDHLEYIDL